MGGIALFRFLHTSDLHLGKRFGQMPEALRGRLTEARHQSITRLNDAAAERAVDTILVAGDVFDTETPTTATVRQALQAMGARPQVRWFLMPGNHDSLQAEELWGRVANEAPGNVVLLLRPKPVALAPNVMLLPAPCPVHRPGRDLSEWMSDAKTPPETIRIGLAHGPVQAFGEDGGSDLIAPDRAMLSNLDYLALGDWHGQIKINERTWYSGTPETDRFKHDTPAQALLVEIEAAGSLPQVSPVPTAGFLWKDLNLDLVADEDATERLTHSMQGLHDRRNILLRLASHGRVGLAARAAIANAAGQAEADFAWMNYDDTALGLEHETGDLDAIDQAGALRQAAEALLHEARSGEASAEITRIAERALSRLYAYCQELEG